MTNEELLKLDFQLLTERTLIYNTALLTTILENQSIILSKLLDTSITQISEQSNQKLKENIERVNEEVKKKTPEYPFER